MTPPRTRLWAQHAQAWREPGQVVGHWPDANLRVDRRLLRARVQGPFWEEIERLDVTLLIGREYEHLLLALSVAEGRPRMSYLVLPHPSGIVFDEAAGSVHVAATRNPNQIFDLRPVTAVHSRDDIPVAAPAQRPLLPTASRYLPGCLYLHDLAIVGGRLHGNATGMNAIVDLAGEPEVVWWPRSVEDDERRPRTTRNFIQLNSIAAGPSLEQSFFTASVDRPGGRRPGQRNFLVDGRGVVFSGATREPIAGGLTRPHSARMHAGELWVDDSGYGRLCVIRDGRSEAVATLPGWTRGLTFCGDRALVATSRVVPRFSQYAPGLDVGKSVCGLHVVDPASGGVLASVEWPWGNQIFAVESVPRTYSLGLPFVAGRPAAAARTRALFYGFRTSRPS